MPQSDPRVARKCATAEVDLGSIDKDSEPSCDLMFDTPEDVDNEDNEDFGS